MESRHVVPIPGSLRRPRLMPEREWSGFPETIPNQRHGFYWAMPFDFHQFARVVYDRREEGVFAGSRLDAKIPLCGNPVR